MLVFDPATDSTRASLPQLLGGKGHGLWTLQSTGWPVPDWVCVTTRAFENQLDAWGLEELNSRLPTAEEAQLVRALCAKRRVSQELHSALHSALLERNLLCVPLMVRSSARAEDGTSSSLAGVFSSFAGAQGTHAALDAVLDCWASAFSESALSTLAALGLKEPTAMAVVVQALVPAKISGVVFSRDPSHPHFFRTRRMAAVYGFGETLVQGSVTPAQATLNLATGEVTCTPGDQTTGLFWQSDAVQEGPVPFCGTSEKMKDDLLKPALLDQVWKLSAQVEKSRGTAVDIEWVLGTDNTLYLVQARPLVGMPSLAALEAWRTETSLCLWDNANVVESFSGVVLPLSYSHARVCYEKVYTEFCKFMGVEKARLKEATPVLASMLGHIRGRVYYNLLNWYRLVHLFPLAGKNSAMMEDMMGVRQSLGPEEKAAFDASLQARTPAPLWRRVALGLDLVRKILFPQTHLQKFETQVNAICDQELARGYANQTATDLLMRYERVRDELLSLWAAPILNDTRCMVAHGIWTKVMHRWIQNPSHRADLESLASHASSRSPLASLEPVVAQDALALELAQGNIPGVQWVLDKTPAQLSYWFQNKSGASDELSDLRKRVDAYLQNFGYRCPDEQKLEVPDFEEDPTPLFASLKAKVAALAQNKTQGAASSPSTPVRLDSAHLRGTKLLSQLPLHKRLVLSGLAKWSANAVGDRERLRLLRGKTFALPRRLFNALELKWLESGFLAQKGDLFYMTVEEIRSFSEGHLDASGLQTLLETRRSTYDRYATEEAPPERFLTRGPVAAYASSPSALAASRVVAPRPQGADANALYGQTASAGHVTGVVLVARTYEEAAQVDGHILVASRTDPGWVPLFSRCKGLVIERGSALSHSAIMARELGIPTLVGVLDATSKLQNGQNVELDASAGCLRPLLA